MSLRVLIAEDHSLVARGLELIVSFADNIEVVGVVDTGDQAVTRSKAERIDVVLMDFHLGGWMDGIETTRRIKEESPDTKVLVLTMFTSPAMVPAAVNDGADGYLFNWSCEALAQAIHDAARGR